MPLRILLAKIHENIMGNPSGTGVTCRDFHFNWVFEDYSVIAKVIYRFKSTNRIILFQPPAVHWFPKVLL